MRGLLECRIDIRADEALASFDEPPDYGDDHDAANQTDRPVHTRRIHVLACGPEEEEAGEDRVDNRDLHSLVSLSLQSQ